MGWIVWDKGQRICNSDGELAFTSFDIALRIFTKNRYFITENGDTKHPTQKPVALYKWLLKNYGFNKDGSKRTILDTHFGSLSIGIAAADMGFDLTAYEIDSDYFRAAIKRLYNHINQLNAFVERPEIEVNGVPINEYVKELINKS